LVFEALHPKPIEVNIRHQNAFRHEHAFTNLTTFDLGFESVFISVAFDY
jgi:hypothetical protein